MKIDILPKARKQLKKIPQEYRKAIVKTIQLLSTTPFPKGYVKLSGKEKRYRVRSGDYRVIYDFSTNEDIIFILRIAHRKEVYKK